MAGPSIAVRIIGDLTGFSKSVTDTATAGEGAASRLHGAFTGALGALNASGVLGPFGEALNGIDEAIGKVAEHGKGIGQTMLGVGTALAGVGVGLSALGSKDQAAHQQLQQAVQATGHDYEDYADQVEKAIGKQEKYGTTAGQTQDALRIMTQAMGDPQKAFDTLGEASNLAAAKHESLTTAATQLSKAYGGSAKVLKEFGIDLKHMTDEHGNAITGAQANARAMQLLGDKISGQADAAANTFGGHLSELKAHFEDMAANLGAKYGPAITAVGTAMAGVGAVFQAAPAIMGILSAAWDALTAAEYASMLPYVAIIAGLALIGVAVYELVTHWSEVWGAIQAATAAVWQWIVDHWPLLLDIILGPIGIAAGLVIQHWNDIVGAAQAVWNWISDNWPLLLAILLGPFAVAALEVKNHWNDIVDFFSGLPGRIVSAIGDVASLLFGKGAEIFQSLINGINSLLGAVPDIPGAVLRAVGNLASLLYQAGRDVIQGLIDGIGSMAGALASKVKDAVGGLVSGAKGLLGIGSPSKVFAEIGMNVMQGYAAGMQAQQSYVGTTMATLLLPTTMPVAPTAPPTPPPRASGPAVHIENATFTTDADIDLLLRRAAWAMQTRAA